MAARACCDLLKLFTPSSGCKGNQVVTRLNSNQHKNKQTRNIHKDIFKNKTRAKKERIYRTEEKYKSYWTNV